MYQSTLRFNVVRKNNASKPTFKAIKGNT